MMALYTETFFKKSGLNPPKGPVTTMKIVN